MDNGDIKLHMLQQSISKYKIDIVGIAETNMCWDLLKYKQWLQQKTRGWLETVH